MLEAVRVADIGASTVARIALSVADLGYDGLIVRHPQPKKTPLSPETLRSYSGIDVFVVSDIETESPSQASGRIGTHRPQSPILIVTGGTKAMNNFAVRQDRIDVLANPIGEHTIDHVLVKTAKTHGVHLELNLRPVLQSSGGNRVRSIQNVRKLWSLIDHYDAPFVVTGGPRSHLEVRSCRDLAAVGETIGIAPDAIKTGMAQWRRILRANKERLTDDYLEPGVHLSTDTEQP